MKLNTRRSCVCCTCVSLDKFFQKLSRAFLTSCAECEGHRLNMELDLQSLFGLLCTAVLIDWDPATPPFPSHLGSYTRAPLVSKDRRHLFVTPGEGGGHVTWSGWGHVGAGFEVIYVPPWSPRVTYGPWITHNSNFFTVTLQFVIFSILSQRWATSIQGAPSRGWNYDWNKIFHESFRENMCKTRANSRGSC